MNKLERLKKLLIARGIKYGLMLAGCLIAFGTVYYFYGSIDDEIRRLKSKDRQLKSQITQLNSRNERLNNTLDLYNKLTSDSALKDMELDRKNISRLLQELSEKYSIRDININIDTLEERKQPPFARDTGTIITTNISLTFNAISDLHTFAFLEEILSEFSGYLNLNSLTVRKRGEINENLLRSLIKSGKAELFETKIDFEWLGLRPKSISEEQKAGTS